MKYIIMCGGNYKTVVGIRPLHKINGETLVERTIRLLREFGINDISVSTNADVNAFDFLDVPILKFENNYSLEKVGKGTGYWVEAFYKTNEPCCYLCGDVWYSRAALKTIIDSECHDFLMFGTRQPLPEYCPKWEEPMGFKVVNQELLQKYCTIFKYYEDNKLFNRKGMSWELYRLIEGFDPNKHILGKRFVAIHDFACDIDHESDTKLIEDAVIKYGVD